MRSSFSLLHLSLSSSLWLAACGGGPLAIGSDDFESFRASLERLEDAYIVEGDILIHSEKKLEEYYRRTFEQHADASSAFSRSSSALTVRIANDVDSIYGAERAARLTYCVSDDFDDVSSTKKSEVVDAIDTAAENWEAILDVDFRYVSSEDHDCDRSNREVFFNVRPSGKDDTWSYAFFPDTRRSGRELRIGDRSGGAPLMMHELGHILGFRHEFERPEYAGCSTSSNIREVTEYDSDSVMHYPMGATSCAGTAPNYSITRLDTLGSQRLYTPNPSQCSLADREVCVARGGGCEPAFSVSGARHDLCRWTATTQSACRDTRGGIWTPWNHSFAQAWPTAVPPGRSGACITQMGNLSCSGEDEDLCLLHGATCERAISTAGHRHDLCRWYQAYSQTHCNETEGIWTPWYHSFAQVWPTAVPEGSSGACITQVGNLD